MMDTLVTALEKYPMSELSVNRLFDDLTLGSCLNLFLMLQ